MNLVANLKKFVIKSIPKRVLLKGFGKKIIFGRNMIYLVSKGYKNATLKKVRIYYILDLKRI
jgi:hypothetical protein